MKILPKILIVVLACIAAGVLSTGSASARQSGSGSHHSSFHFSRSLADWSVAGNHIRSEARFGHHFNRLSSRPLGYFPSRASQEPVANVYYLSVDAEQQSVESSAVTEEKQYYFDKKVLYQVAPGSYVVAPWPGW